MISNKSELDSEFIRNSVKYPTIIEVLDSVTSTNDILKEYASKNEPSVPHVLIAARQTKGKGSRGRSFFSPDSSGIYISVLLYHDLSPDECLRLTTAAALAASVAIEKVTGVKTDIKWVNDLYKDGKKLSGILCESSVKDSKTVEWSVIGIGINIKEPSGGFPPEIRESATAIYSSPDSLPSKIREKIAAEFINEYLSLCLDIRSRKILDGYKSRLCVLDKKIFVIKGDEKKEGRAIELLDDFSLLVEYENGERERISFLEVSLRFA